MTLLDSKPSGMTGTGRSGRTPHVTVLLDRCAGCQECVVRCPTAALSMDTLRWVAEADDKLCVGCRQCVRTCPFSAIQVEGPLVVGARTEVATHHPANLLKDVSEIRPGFGSWADALSEAERCLQCPDPTCVRGCPAHNDIPGFIKAVSEQDLETAHAVLRRTTVLPDVCSRVCDQLAQCEGSCSWSLAGGTPVAIGKIERFIADNAPVPMITRRSDDGAGMRVAVVGSGPAAMGAAAELVSAGTTVSVYEKDEQPGGLLTWGIPDFTLPADVADRPWRQLIEAGVELHCSTEILPADVDRLAKENDAVLLAHGAGVGLRLPVPGGDLPGITDATTFLKDGRAAIANSTEISEFMAGFVTATERGTPHVLVLGAGNTAMDVARTARRLGANATCIDWLDERFALARPDEIAEARSEGVKIRFLTTLQRLDAGAGGRVGTATLAATRQADRTKLPKVLSSQTDKLTVDFVVMAMGYRADAEFAKMLKGTPVRRVAPAGLPDRRWIGSGHLANPASEYAHHNAVGRLALGREVGLWSAALPFGERLWAAGDALVGPSTVVESMAQGRRAAQAILLARAASTAGGAAGAPGRLGNVLVAYESRGGKTAKLAQRIATTLSEHGANAVAMRLDAATTADYARADTILVGTWVEGFVVAGVGPAKPARKHLAALPRLAGKRAAVFCTYGVHPRGTLAKMRQAFEARGATVVAEAAFGRGTSAKDVARFLSQVRGDGAGDGSGDGSARGARQAVREAER